VRADHQLAEQLDPTRLCVLGCADRSRTDIWPRPPRPRADGLQTCRPCADRIRLVLDEVLELAVGLELVTAAGSVPAALGQTRKRIKDEPVAPTPLRMDPTALTDVRSRRGGFVPPAPSTRRPVVPLDEHGHPITVEQARADAADAQHALHLVTAMFGPRSDAARAAASTLSIAQARARAAAGRPPAAPRPVNPHDGQPGSVVGFLDHWTDVVRVGRQLGAGSCPTCGQPAHFVRLVLPEAGARTTGLLVRCEAGHLSRPDGQGELVADHRGGHGHRASTGPRYGMTLMTSVGLLRRHNEWLCQQHDIAEYWSQLRALRAALGQAHGEPRPYRIGVCPNPTGGTHTEVQHHHDLATGYEHVCAGPAEDCTWTRDIDADVPDECGQSLYAQPYNDSIECTRCGRVWTHKQWKHLGRTIGVLP
jgi:hypothetical protein